MKGTVLITGASSGIGWEFALLFAEADYHVVAVARNEIKLKELQLTVKDQYGTELDYIAKDLVQPQSVDELIEEMKEKNYSIDYLVNNAGFGQFGSFLDTDGKEEMDMIILNVSVLTHLSKQLLPNMVKKKHGGILNVASTASFQPGPLMAVYYATKAYVLSFTEALANEMNGTGVTVTAFCPGPTSTGFEKRANLGTSKLFQKGVMDVQTATKIGFRGFLQGKEIVIPGFKNRLLSRIVSFMPRKLVTKIVRKMQETRR
ncbi:SDR family NAD(P)-dependent oxidoreductase [Shimazuella alba]|uniref:SDR family NAD(P)-dependent oxidoreductase n=1 Tax=Shimazuella alba TaxID=2690964 RepID=A0A6I4VWR9_9BACL|nr:SDR family oxidoreductase [Shimazuella alba]MXQ54485.1 SDR family NAD(P)-dependent oxidoreductase [Shimazuella alba]